MLASTQDVLARHGINSTKELEQRLYDDIGGAKISDVLNQLIGNVFANPLKALSLVCTSGHCSDGDVLKEANRVLFGREVSTKRLEVAGITYTSKFLSEPVLITTSAGQGTLRMSKTLFGEMLGDLFAVQGIGAAADPEINLNFSNAFGSHFNPDGISTPLLSMLLMRWASDEHDNPSLRNFAKRLGVAGETSADYKLTEYKLSRAALRLRKWGLVSYDPVKNNPSFYVPARNRPALKDALMRDGEALSAVWKEAVRKDGGTIKNLAAAANYSESHTQKVVSVLVERGYLRMPVGEKRSRRSSVIGRSRAGKTWKYAEKAGALVGFNQDNIGSVWKNPVLDAMRILSYRREVVDPIAYGGAPLEDFNASCRTAYEANHMTRKRRYTN